MTRPKNAHRQSQSTPPDIKMMVAKANNAVGGFLHPQDVKLVRHLMVVAANVVATNAKRYGPNDLSAISTNGYGIFRDHKHYCAIVLTRKLDPENVPGRFVVEVRTSGLLTGR